VPPHDARQNGKLDAAHGTRREVTRAEGVGPETEEATSGRPRQGPLTPA
jgi:hypothetical protein